LFSTIELGERFRAATAGYIQLHREGWRYPVLTSIQLAGTESDARTRKG
jgi:hypothetical protein